MYMYIIVHVVVRLTQWVDVEISWGTCVTFVGNQCTPPNENETCPVLRHDTAGKPCNGRDKQQQQARVLFSLNHNCSNSVSSIIQPLHTHLHFPVEPIVQYQRMCQCQSVRLHWVARTCVIIGDANSTTAHCNKKRSLKNIFYNLLWCKNNINISIFWFSNNTSP